MLSFVYRLEKILVNTNKHLQKLKKLNLKAEKCLSRDEAKKILIKANKTQSKISI